MSIADMSDVVSVLGTGTYEVTRRIAVAPVKGKAQSPIESTIEIDAAIQPVGGVELQRLPEGMRTSEVIAIWTTSELFTRTQTNEPDSITVDGFDYEIQVVQDWVSNGNYYKALAAKVGR